MYLIRIKMFSQIVRASRGEAGRGLVVHLALVPCVITGGGVEHERSVQGGGDVQAQGLQHRDVLF